MSTAVNPFGQGEERSFQQALQKRGLKVRVMPLNRIEWLNLLRGIFSLSFVSHHHRVSFLLTRHMTMAAAYNKRLAALCCVLFSTIKA